MAQRFPSFNTGALHSHINRILPANPQTRNFLAAVGALYLGVKGVQALIAEGRGLFSYVLARPLGLAKDLHKVGEWVVITGASDGIGKEYALQLAAKGFNVVLIARNQQKTELVAQEIRNTYKVLAKVIVVDLARMTGEDADRIHDEIRMLRIALLINNAGVYPPEARFMACPPTHQEAEETIHLNVTALVLVTRAVLPIFLTQGKGYIMNMSSILGEKPVIGAALYSATKTFVDYFSQSLDYEYRCKGIRVQSVMTGMVRTKMLNVAAHSNPFSADVKPFAANALALVGVRQRHHGHWKHALMSTVGSMMPLFDLLRGKKD